MLFSRQTRENTEKLLQPYNSDLLRLALWCLWDRWWMKEVAINRYTNTELWSESLGGWRRRLHALQWVTRAGSAWWFSRVWPMCVQVRSGEGLLAAGGSDADAADRCRCGRDQPAAVRCGGVRRHAPAELRWMLQPRERRVEEHRVHEHGPQRRRSEHTTHRIKI